MPEGSELRCRETTKLDCSVGRRKYWLGIKLQAQLLEGQSRFYMTISRLGTGHGSELELGALARGNQAFGKRLREIPGGFKEVAGELKSLKRSDFLVN